MKISIITTTYNHQKYIIDCIKSVELLRLEPLQAEIEHIIYDDASTDDTHKFFEGIHRPNLIYIRGATNKGPAFGRNAAIKKSSGDYIFVLDSDDVILQRTIYNFITAALQRPNTKWFISNFLRVDKNLKYIFGEDYYGWHFKSKASLLNAIFNGEHYIQHNAFFKRELFIAAGGYAESMRVAEDIDLFVRFILYRATPTYLNFTSHLHRVHGRNLSKNIDKAAHKSHAESIREKYK